jgi:hypothetical protein
MLGIENSGPTRRIALGSGFAVLLLAAAVGTTIWRYEAALSKSDAALTTRSEVVRSGQASTAFWQEREAMNEYLLLPSAEIRGEILGHRDAFDAATKSLGADVAAEADLATRTRTANAAYVALFDTNRNVAATKRAESLAERLNRAEPGVVTPLADLQHLYTTEINHDLVQVKDADRQALIGHRFRRLRIAFGHARRVA